MICLNCEFWGVMESGDLDHFLYTSDMPPYLLKPRGYCSDRGLTTCYDEGCEHFKNKFQEVDG
jgi:hypothetical protein